MTLQTCIDKSLLNYFLFVSVEREEQPMNKAILVGSTFLLDYMYFERQW